MDDGMIAMREDGSLQVKQVRSAGWTKARRKRFLDVLATTCNVTMAAAAVGVHKTNPYVLRRRDPAFAALWDQALAIGYERLEAAVLRRALIGVNEIEIEIEGEEPSFDYTADPSATVPASGARPACWRPGAGPYAIAPLPELQAALVVLNRHRATVEGRKAPHASRRRATDEETNAALKRALDGLVRRARKTAE